MITIIPIEPLNDQHAMLIVAAFNIHFIDGGGRSDDFGFGLGFGNGNGDGDGVGDGRGSGYGYSNGGDGRGSGGKCPEEWRTK